jgi:circadian clock protein KaiC
MHLANIHLLVQRHRPTVVVVDPATNLVSIDNGADVHGMLMRLVDYLKSKGITTLITTLTSGGQAVEQTEVDISSLIDTWILLKSLECNGERNRGLYVLKSRGMAHSNQIREYRLTDHGMKLQDVYVGAGQVLTGSARMAHEAREKAEELSRRQAAQQRQAELAAERKALEAQIAMLQAKLAIHGQELQSRSTEEQVRRRQLDAERGEMAFSRQADGMATPVNGGKRNRGSR